MRRESSVTGRYRTSSLSAGIALLSLSEFQYGRRLVGILQSVGAHLLQAALGLCHYLADVRLLLVIQAFAIFAENLFHLGFHFGLGIRREPGRGRRLLGGRSAGSGRLALRGDFSTRKEDGGSGNRST